jgi:hypothetical protein
MIKKYLEIYNIYNIYNYAEKRFYYFVYAKQLGFEY